MNNQIFQQIQAIELRRLLELVGDDPIAAPQLKARLEDAEKQVESERQQKGSLFQRKPSFFRGPPSSCAAKA